MTIVISGMAACDRDEDYRPSLWDIPNERVPLDVEFDPQQQIGHAWLSRRADGIWARCEIPNPNGDRLIGTGYLGLTSLWSARRPPLPIRAVSATVLSWRPRGRNDTPFRIDECADKHLAQRIEDTRQPAVPPATEVEAPRHDPVNHPAHYTSHPDNEENVGNTSSP